MRSTITTAENEQKVVVELTREEALVLFEWLSKHDGSLPLDDSSEQTVLWRLEAALEGVLVEPLATDYLALVAAAREHVKRSTTE